MVDTNKQYKDVTFVLHKKKKRFLQDIMSLKAIGIHFSVVNKSHISYPEHLRLMPEDNF